MKPAYYNEIKPYAAQWTRNLIAAGVIPAGDVDERSIVDVRPDDLAPYGQCHFFSGISVWAYALRLAGWDDFRCVWTGSCPCQPFSIGGDRRGFEDERHLWPFFFDLIRQCRPPVVFGEQVASADGLSWLDCVSSDLEAQDYAFGAADLCAAGVGFHNIRQRLFWVAHTAGAGLEGQIGPKRQDQRAFGQTAPCRPPDPSDVEWLPCRDGRLRGVRPGTRPLAYGPADPVGRLRAYGNAINAEVARTFIAAAMPLLP